VSGASLVAIKESQQNTAAKNATKGIRAGAATIGNLLSLTNQELTTKIVAALEDQRGCEQPRHLAYKRRQAPPETAAPVQEPPTLTANTTIVNIPGHNTFKPEAQVSAKAAIQVKGKTLADKLANLIKGQVLLGSIEGKAGKQAVRFAQLSVKNFEAMRTT